MEMTASCEGGQKWGNSTTPLISISPPAPEPIEPPQVFKNKNFLIIFNYYYFIAYL